MPPIVKLCRKIIYNLPLNQFTTVTMAKSHHYSRLTFGILRPVRHPLECNFVKFYPKKSHFDKIIYVMKIHFFIPAGLDNITKYYCLDIAITVFNKHTNILVPISEHAEH
jgi:hypothetical protein